MRGFLCERHKENNDKNQTCFPNKIGSTLLEQIATFSLCPLHPQIFVEEVKLGEEVERVGFFFYCCWVFMLRC